MKSYLLIGVAMLSVAFLPGCAQHGGSATPSLSNNMRNTASPPPPDAYHENGLIQSSNMSVPTRP